MRVGPPDTYQVRPAPPVQALANSLSKLQTASLADAPSMTALYSHLARQPRESDAALTAMRTALLAAFTLNDALTD